LDGKEHFAWQDGYSVFSVSGSLIGIIKKYLRQQEEHHQETTFSDELCNLAAEHSVDNT